MSKRKVEEDDFFLGEQGLIDALGKDMVENIKQNDYDMYVRLRNSPCFMPSDIARESEDLIQTI